MGHCWVSLKAAGLEQVFIKNKSVNQRGRRLAHAIIPYLEQVGSSEFCSPCGRGKRKSTLQCLWHNFRYLHENIDFPEMQFKFYKFKSVSYTKGKWHERNKLIYAHIHSLVLISLTETVITWSNFMRQ